MDSYLADRADSTHDLVMVFEHLSHNAADWIIAHPGDARWLLDQAWTVIKFIQGHRIVHFDGDLFNFVTDGTIVMLADHGLVMDPTFDLNAAERAFLDANQHFDEGNLLLSFGHQVFWMYRALPDAARHLIDVRVELDGRSFEADTTKLPIGESILDLLSRHDAAIVFMHEFYGSARRNWSTSTTLDDARLAQLIVA